MARLDAVHAEADSEQKTARELNAKFEAARDALATAEDAEITKFEATDAFKAAAQKADSARDAFQQAEEASLDAGAIRAAPEGARTPHRRPAPHRLRPQRPARHPS